MSNLEDQSIIALQVFDNATSAHIAKAKLKANNIPCFLADEPTAGWDSLGKILGRVKLMAFARDAEKCRNLLSTGV